MKNINPKPFPFFSILLGPALALALLFPGAQPLFAGEKVTLTLLAGAANSYKITQGLSQAMESLGNRADLYYYTEEDLAGNRIDPKVIARSGIIVLDDMYKGLTDHVLERVDFDSTKVYGLSTVPKHGDKIISDPKVKAYARPLTQKNLTQLIFFLLNRDLGFDIPFEPAQAVPRSGVFHPESDQIFKGFDAFLSWYKKSGRYTENGPWVGIPEVSSYVFPGEAGQVVSRLVQGLEAQGINVLPAYAYPASKAMAAFFWDEKTGRSRVDLIASLAFKFTPRHVEKTRALLKKLNVPVLNPFRVHFLTLDQWKKDPQGLGPMEVTYAMANPEFFGLTEPSALGGKKTVTDPQTGKNLYTYASIDDNIDFFVKRVKAWHRLKVTPNKDKKIVIMFWNHTPGKQNIGATYLNLFKSLEEILARLSREGYHIDGDLPSEEEIKDLILTSGRNIGSWAPGELDRLMTRGRVARLPLDQYKTWYQNLDPAYRQAVEKEWGQPGESKIMIKDNAFILPCVTLGNLVLMPQPSRGWHDDPTKLYHSTKLFPHHQYTAFYLWLRHGFNADALVSLGTHGSHEWLPGKQAGLSQSCSPEVLIQDIPNLYPYIMDNIGEGTQAKRRGRAVILDYLIPPVKKAGVYESYGELSDLINSHEETLGRSPELAAKKFDRIRAMVQNLGLLQDLMLDTFEEKDLEALEHYLMELGETHLPFGLHTFGVSPRGEGLDEFASLISQRNPDQSPDTIKKNLGLCSLEMDHLVNGLGAGYVPAAEANDPLRNPDAIPTGNNFYGFDPAKVPSRAAWELGRDQAEEMIAKYKKEHGRYPEKIGLVFWSIELQRNEGTQVGCALHLMGMKPVWDKNNRVTGVEPIPAGILKRPRIDVHMQVSGLFRDNFPNLILLLDQAVQKAGQLTDIENFITLNNAKIKAYLLEKGYDEKAANRLKQLRVFSNAPGAYGNTIEDLIPASGLWEKDEEIADVFINFVSFAYGKDVWGKPLKSAYKKNLEDVKITMHTRSSNLFMNLDTDGVFSELGGLALAVKRVSGTYPDVVLSNQADPDAPFVEDAQKSIAKELRARYLNPKWIQGMKKENYAGAREMNRFTEHLWGWQVATPFVVDGNQWKEIYEVYIQDKYGMELKEFFHEHNPWARQSMAARMLEAGRKGYWDTPEKIKKDLARTYALDVIDKGVSCCEHTCNNPMLQKFVSQVISLYGLLPPETLDQFKAVVAKAVGRTQAEHEAAHAKVRESLKRPMEKNREEEQVKAQIQAENQVKGFEMVEEKMDETKMTASGASWMIMIIVAGFLGLLALGWKKRRI